MHKKIKFEVKACVSHSRVIQKNRLSVEKVKFRMQGEYENKKHDYICKKEYYMTKNQMTDLHKLSVKEKIKVVQELWDDIAMEQSVDTLSTEHKKILNERILKINSGSAQFKSWSEVRNKYQNLL